MADQSPRPGGDRPGARPGDEDGGAELGGDPVCWLERVCDRCGGLTDGPPRPRCERCGAPGR